MKYHAKYSHGEIFYEVIDGVVTVNRAEKREERSHYVMPDIQAYQSQLTGEMVTSRSRHRELLREHNCIEVGNETKYLRQKDKAPPPGLKRQLIDIVNSKL